MAISNFVFSVNSALHYVLQSPWEKWGNILAILKWKETKPAHLKFLLILYYFIFSRRPIFYLLLLCTQGMPCLHKTVYQPINLFDQSYARKAELHLI